eukprot:scaffold1237_cov243-Pinguiococcus_pyrenoidosus.AAC.13
MFSTGLLFVVGVHFGKSLLARRHKKLCYDKAVSLGMRVRGALGRRLRDGESEGDSHVVFALSDDRRQSCRSGTRSRGT